ncbi:hypothetical protein [Actinobacillus equuli]|uniref:hypothetical protein n=1 Tax=Actinobacillus equuli TaxID=718 RepID=UPI002442727D|nr:hypothetical protein [Actinobacillus equuli]WGE52402.1 hypothetical protein NYR69_08105 [Actinobacillus equuli subsp. haemolyticus]
MAEYDYKARCKQLESYLKAVHTLFYESDLEKVNKLDINDVQRSELRQEIHNVINKWTNKEEIM